MRHRLAVLVAATTSAVVLAFLIPLLLLVRTLAEERAVAAATQEAQAIASVAGDASDDRGRTTLATLISASEAGEVSVYLPDGHVIGTAVDDDRLARARRGESFVVSSPNSAVVYLSSVTESGVAVTRSYVPQRLYHNGVRRATMTIVGLGVVMLAASVAAAVWLARRVSRPFVQLAEAAEAMREGALDRKVPEEGLPEAAELARSLNRLAARVAQLLGAERDAVADLAHRLRTPVTALRLDTDAIAEREVADRLRHHVAHLERTVDAIVHDARRPVRAAVATSCDVGRVVGERVAFWSALADDQDRPLSVELPGRPAPAPIDAADLADLVDVLIDNVFAHTEEGVPLAVGVIADVDGAVTITVEDGGGGLPGSDVLARGRSGTGSTGLGLDIVRRAALASGGRLDIGRSRLGGALVRVTFRPRAA